MAFANGLGVRNWTQLKLGASSAMWIGRADDRLTDHSRSTLNVHLIADTYDMNELVGLYAMSTLVAF